MRLDSTTGKGWRKTSQKRQVCRYSTVVTHDGTMRITGRVSLGSAFRAAQRVLADRGADSVLRVRMGTKQLVITAITTLQEFCRSFNMQSAKRKYPADASTMVNLR